MNFDGYRAVWPRCGERLSWSWPGTSGGSPKSVDRRQSCRVIWSRQIPTSSVWLDSWSSEGQATQADRVARRLGVDPRWPLTVVQWCEGRRCGSRRRLGSDDRRRAGLVQSQSAGRRGAVSRSTGPLCALGVALPRWGLAVPPHCELLWVVPSDGCNSPIITGSSETSGTELWGSAEVRIQTPQNPAVPLRFYLRLSPPMSNAAQERLHGGMADTSVVVRVGDTHGHKRPIRKAPIGRPARVIADLLGLATEQG